MADASHGFFAAFATADRAMFPVYRAMKFHDVNPNGLICYIITVQRGPFPHSKISY